MNNKDYDKYKYALELEKSGNIDESIKILRRLHALNPDDLVIKNIFARFSLKKEETRLWGINLLEELANSDNFYTSLNALYSLGDFYYNEFNQEKAISYYNLFIEKANNAVLDDNLNKKLNYVIFQRGKIYMQQNNFTDAEADFIKLLDTELATISLNQLTFIKIREEKYTEAYVYYQLMDMNIKKNNSRLHNLEVYLKSKLRLLNKNDIKKYNYIYNQLINYDCNFAINHIKRNQKDKSKCNKSKFDKNISVNNLFDIVTSIISNEKPTFHDTIDIYLIEFDYIVGNSNGIKTNVVEVKTLPNSKNILTMYPTSKNFPINIKAPKNEKEKTKELKRESQIDKFNKRYGL